MLVEKAQYVRMTKSMIKVSKQQATAEISRLKFNNALERQRSLFLKR